MREPRNRATLACGAIASLLLPVLGTICWVPTVQTPATFNAEALHGGIDRNARHDLAAANGVGTSWRIEGSIDETDSSSGDGLTIDGRLKNTGGDWMEFRVGYQAGSVPGVQPIPPWFGLTYSDASAQIDGGIVTGTVAVDNSNNVPNYNIVVAGGSMRDRPDNPPMAGSAVLTGPTGSTALFGSAAWIVDPPTGSFTISLAVVGASSVSRAKLFVGTPGNPGPELLDLGAASFSPCAGVTGVGRGIGNVTFPAFGLPHLANGNTFVEIVTTQGSITGLNVPVVGQVRLRGRATSNSRSRDPVIGVRSFPRIGNPGFGYTGREFVPMGPVILLLGRRFRPPLDLSLIGGQPGSFLYVDAFQFIGLVADIRGAMVAAVPIPLRTSLIGARLESQWFELDPRLPYPLTLANTRALGITIGS